MVLLLHNAELLNGEILTTLCETQVVIEVWRRHYDRVRPHSSLGYKAAGSGDRGLAGLASC